ncbi:MAG: amidohydrolase [Treponema sp.]|jgi:amidohydrolase|nr:amidohydrolase [Treponema sp.]
MSTETDNRIKEAVGKHFDRAKGLCADLASHPEISGEEHESSAKFVGALKSAGYRLEYPYCGMKTAFRAVLENGEGPAAAILAEYDALPGIGHGCGHNLHGSLSVLAGLALAELKDLFRGTLYVIGTPDEEVSGGKIAMADRGVFDGLSLAVMMHSCAGGFCQADMDALSLRSYTVTFSGQTAHVAASPWKGRSALAAARKFLDLVDARRECFTPDVKVNAIFKDGGEAVNVIPARAEIRIEFRTDAMGKLAVVDDAIKKCARGAAIAMDCEESLRLNYDDFADMVRILPLEDGVERIFSSLGLRTEPVSPPIGSTDMGNVSYRCPAIQPLISISDEALSLHTKEFAAATCRKEAWESMSLGAEALAILVLKVFNDEDFRRKTGDEFQKRLELKRGRL